MKQSETYSNMRMRLMISERPQTALKFDRPCAGVGGKVL